MVLMVEQIVNDKCGVDKSKNKSTESTESVLYVPDYGKVLLYSYYVSHT